MNDNYNSVGYISGIYDWEEYCEYVNNLDREMWVSGLIPEPELVAVDDSPLPVCDGEIPF